MSKISFSIVGIVITFIIVGSVIFGISALLLMLAWGWFAAPVLGLPLLSFSEAFGLALLTSSLGTLFIGANVYRSTKSR